MNIHSQRITQLSSTKRQLLLQRLKNPKITQQSSLSHVERMEMTVEALKAEADLDAEIYPVGQFSGSLESPKIVLLTGATGFIGAFLLDEILQQTQADVYCLVRASDTNHARQRIQNNLESYLIWDDSQRSRIIPVVGDLAQPHLGLSNEDFQTFADRIDIIYHCGASVKWIYPYPALKATNVLGTQEIIRLACQTKVKPLHFISTVGVFSSPTYNAPLVMEQEDLENSGSLYGGYAQSKWVAEKLVTIAGSRGLPITIHRPNTEGHSQTGVFNPQDHLCKILKGCIQLKSAPYDLDLTVSSAPIDYVSKAIVSLSAQRESLGKVFHLVNPHPLSWAEWLNQIASLGYDLQPLPYQVWKTELMNQVRNSQANELYDLSPIFSDSLLEHAKIPIFDCQNTLQGLADTSIICPPIDLKLLSVYFSHFIQQGFLEAPQNGEFKNLTVSQ
jgi:thioester reductase-like protein